MGSTPNLHALCSLFFDSTERLGAFRQVAPDDMPRRFRSLLAHDKHMTVTVEREHGSPVNLSVLDKQITASHYARKILLARQSDGVVVQFGIMKIKLAVLDREVREQIESESIPLGRVLIDHNVLRHVELASLYEVAPGEELRGLLGMDADDVTFGRTALIHVAGEPAIELLEIVAPVEPGQQPGETP